MSNRLAWNDLSKAEMSDGLGMYPAPIRSLQEVFTVSKALVGLCYCRRRLVGIFTYPIGLPNPIQVDPNLRNLGHHARISTTPHPASVRTFDSVIVKMRMAIWQTNLVCGMTL